MYNLPEYKEQDPQKIRAFIKAHPFAFLSGCNAEQEPVVTQVPFLIEENNGQIILRGHMMKNTDHHRAFSQNENALVVFTGAHTYVSASWYANPQQGSTWNYMSVHARGKMNFLEEEKLLEVLERTTAFFEKDNSPSLFKNLPREYIQRLIKAIVAFEIKVEKTEHIFKLSQNRDKKSYEHIITKLNEGDAGAIKIAEEMKTRKDHLYSKEG
ncbi:MAG: FMN-binding negative transcriptional regulator [Chitinophagaceae bacterium]|nr:FMN-binding negative transcriptional regulator [Chitinophagaceae bacterium]